MPADVRNPMRMGDTAPNPRRNVRQRAGARLLALRRRTIAWKRSARRAITLALVGCSMLGPVHDACGQMGQAAMAPASGIVNNGIQRFQNLSENGPGWMYWGVNAADRGLGYVGSYMTLGGFVPIAEDDLGGFWAADLRGHLSTYGGFFSNVGAVRKQFIGGTLLGVGVYWDYDGDQNQYATTNYSHTFGDGTTSGFSFAGGQAYNQVGVSGEWLTDWGNLRSNGYIPVGSTAQLLGPFTSNLLLCENGINAALGGVDLEVGAYIPGLSDWAGMISVGGYAYGNTRYAFPDGAAAVPWFGGVYTRLDMTFIKNWDFSLQANNDSYFDWTGFARLTYRMGGSRRRNVPDQVEQPMMRNEHIVRAYQAPQVAINPETGNPYRVFHVDNAAAVGGNGSAESPFTTLTPAQAAATLPYDIVYVHTGNSAAMPYITPVNGYAFATQNQYLIGEGSALKLPTLNCGPEALFVGTRNGLYPVITNPIGPAIAVDQNGSVVSHLKITGSPIGISDGAGLAAPGVATISDVIVAGGAGIPQKGVLISAANSTGTFNFDRLQLVNLTDGGFMLASPNGRATITNSSFRNIQGSAVLVSGNGARATISRSSIADTFGTGVLVSGSGAGVVLTSSTIANTTGNAVVAAGERSTVSATDVAITGTTTSSALVASGSGATITAVRGTIATTGSDAAIVSGVNATMSLATTRIRGSNANGVSVSGSGARLFVTGSSSIERSGVDGLNVTGTNVTVLVQDSAIVGSGNNGVTVESGPNTTSQVTLLKSRIVESTGYAVYADGLSGTSAVLQVFGSRIQTAGLGVTAIDSNLDVGRDPTSVTGVATQIVSTGDYGVSASGDSVVRVANATISGVNTGILVDNGNDVGTNAGKTVNLTATSNVITSNTTGISVIASGTSSTFAPPSRVVADIAANRITTTGSSGIRLQTQNPVASPGSAGVIQISNAGSAAQLGAINFNTSVLEVPVTAPSQVFYNSPPPTLPPQPVPLVPLVPTPP